jgi:hypothetical protein
MNESVRIHQILDSGSNKDKISVLESLSQSNDQETINKIISKLDDSEIQGGKRLVLFSLTRMTSLNF